jgi:hypothetical protein
MFNITSDIKRVATTIVGTLVLTTTFVGAAIGPARAIETTPVVAANAVSDRAHA